VVAYQQVATACRMTGVEELLRVLMAGVPMGRLATGVST